jgi:hypothetical protein
MSFIVLSAIKSNAKEVTMADDNRGFASMPQDEVEDIARKGANSLTDEQQAEGGRNSHEGGRPQGS